MGHKFTNDYSSLCHPRILKALANLEDEQNVAYGLDKHSLHAESLIKKTFNSVNGKVYFISGGTMTNLLFISYALFLLAKIRLFLLTDKKLLFQIANAAL